MTKTERQILAVGLANLKLNALNNSMLNNVLTICRSGLMDKKLHKELISIEKQQQIIKTQSAKDLAEAFEIIINEEFDLSKLKL